MQESRFAVRRWRAPAAARRPATKIAEFLGRIGKKTAPIGHGSVTKTEAKPTNRDESGARPGAGHHPYPSDSTSVYRDCAAAWRA